MSTISIAAGTVVLPVGKAYHLRFGKDTIIYAGMPADDIFSLVQIKSKGYRGLGWNLFFPRRQQDIDIDGVDLHVIRVTPLQIEIRAAR